jgi:O-antigen ligase
MNEILLTPASRLFAVFVGVAVPSLVIGRVALAGVLIAAFVCVLFLPGKAANRRSIAERARSPIGIMAGVTFAAWLPGVIVSIDSARSFEAWGRTVILVAAAAYLWAACSKDGRLIDLCLRALLVASAVLIAVCFISLYAAPEFLSLIRAKGWTSTNAVLALKSISAVAMLLIPTVLLAGQRLGGPWWTLAISVTAGLLGLIWILYVRASIFGILAMLFMAGPLYFWSRRQRGRAFVAFIVVAAVTVAVFVWLHETRTELDPNGLPGTIPYWLIDYQRQAIFKFTLDLAAQSPWFGNGINVINFLPGADTRIPGMGEITYIPGHPHDWPVEILAETGMVGLAPLLCLVVMLFVGLARDYIATRDPAVLAGLAVNTAYWASGLFSFSFWSAWWQASFLILFALCLAGRRTPPAGGVSVRT